MGLTGGGCKADSGESLHKAGECPAVGLGGNGEKSRRGGTHRSVNVPNASTVGRSTSSI